MCDVLQHSGSEGVLPGERHPLQAAVSCIALESSLGEPEVDRPAEEEEGLGSRKASLEQLICSEEEAEEVGRLSQQRSHRAEDSEPDEILLEDDQVDDFASSVLAAISCWHYRVQAFLSTTATVRLSAASLVFIACVFSLIPQPALRRFCNTLKSWITALPALPDDNLPPPTLELSFFCCMSFKS